MKPPQTGKTSLALGLAALAFATSTIYLGLQLREERMRAAQVAAQSQALEARVAEIEKARAALVADRATAQPAQPESQP